MKQVSKEDFFAVVGPRAIYPTPGPERSVWKDQKTGEVVGYSYPGYLCRNLLGKYQSETTYFLNGTDYHIVDANKMTGTKPPTPPTN